MSSYFLGGDCSKGYCDFVLIDKKKKLVMPAFQLDDTFDGHQVLIGLLRTFCKENPNASLYCGFESTGGLENNWLAQLVRLSQFLPLYAARLNPNGVNKYQAAALERTGTDAISAFYIACYLSAFPEKVTYNEDNPFESLRKQFTYIQLLKKQKTQLLNHLSILVYTSFPFLVQYCKSGVPDYVLTLLKAYPSPSKLARVRKATLEKIPYISSSKAESILTDAKNSVSSMDDEVSAMIIQSTVEQIIQLAELIRTQKAFMEEKCNLPEVDLLTTIPGVGRYSAIVLMLNIVSAERFETVKRLGSYFGINPEIKESGDGKKGVRMSKAGRKAPREILFMVAKSAVIHNPLIKDYYQKQRQKGMVWKAAIGVCMHKILRIVYGMLKNNTAFDPEIDLQNREKDIKQEKKRKPSKREQKRRFQKRDSAAPISGKQRAKRNKSKLTQKPESPALKSNAKRNRKKLSQSLE